MAGNRLGYFTLTTSASIEGREGTVGLLTSAKNDFAALSATKDQRTCYIVHQIHNERQITRVQDTQIQITHTYKTMCHIQSGKH